MSMDYVHLGRTGLKVSRLALGTMNFGELTDEPTGFSIMDAALEAGINFFDTADVYGGPVGMGVLGGALRKMAEGRRGSPYMQMRIQKFRPQLEAYEGLCTELGEPPSDVALAWVLHNPVVTAAISGPRTVEQLRQNLKAPSLKLSAQTLAELDAIWPGPGGEAPVAYAW
jgi:aryl-alcohol dehydrogenase-like predicted oxidoreductase